MRHIPLALLLASSLVPLAAEDLGGGKAGGAANDLGDIGRVTRIDTDRRSATQHTILASIPVDPGAFSSGGAFGICATPDGTTVCVSIAEDGAHPIPVLITIDARTDLVTGTPIAVQSMPATVGVQQF